jgi:hypothetical protein
MSLILDKAVRNQIGASLLAVRQTVEELKGQTLDLPGIDVLTEELINKNHQTALDADRSFLEPETSIAYYGVLALGIMSITAEHDTPILPLDWINPDERPNPNLVVAHLVNSMTNYALAVLRLVEAGLESPARSLLRNFLELSWLVLVVTADQGKMVTYSGVDSDEQEYDAYSKHFAAQKVRRQLTEIEQNLGLPPDATEALSSRRSKLYGFYSKNIHHGYSSGVLGSYAFPVESSGLLTC